MYRRTDEQGIIQSTFIPEGREMCFPFCPKMIKNAGQKKSTCPTVLTVVFDVHVEQVDIINSGYYKLWIL